MMENKLRDTELATEKTIKKVFEPETHMIVYYGNVMLGTSEIYDGDSELAVEAPDGYMLIYYKISDRQSDRQMGPMNGFYNYGSYTFINTLPVEATGVYDEEQGEYLFEFPGKVVKKTKKVKARKKQYINQ